MKKTILLISMMILGVLFGLLLGISIKYPLNIEQIEKSKTTCIDHGGLQTILIKVNGQVDSVICGDGISLVIKKTQLSQQQSPNQE